jgi:hypothetical protein
MREQLLMALAGRAGEEVKKAFPACVFSVADESSCTVSHLVLIRWSAGCAGQWALHYIQTEKQGF